MWHSSSLLAKLKRLQIFYVCNMSLLTNGESYVYKTALPLTEAGSKSAIGLVFMAPVCFNNTFLTLLL
jgi:hypothetical protein